MLNAQVEKEKIHEHERACAHEHLNLLLHFIMGVKVNLESLQPQITPISAPAPLKSGLLCCVHINTADPEKKALRGKDLALLIWASDESLIRQMCGVDFRRCASVPSGTQR